MFFRIKWIAPIMILFVTLLMGVSYFAPLPAHAEDKPSITMESELGFNGNSKLGEWTPLTITLTSDTDISGEIVVQTQTPYTDGSVTQVKAVDLPAGTPKKISFGVVANRFDKLNSAIRFYRGNAESGKLIPFSAGNAYLNSFPQDGTLVGVLASDPDSANFLRTLNGSGGNVMVIPLNKNRIPRDGTLLTSLNVLFLNNYSSDALGKDQVQAIHSWVKKGGTLVLSGGMGYPKSAKGFEDLSPVDYIGSMNVSEMPELAKLGTQKLTFEQPFPVSRAKLKEGAAANILLKSDPLIASWSVGKGRVVYAAYDIAMEPLNEWSGHPYIWNAALQINASDNNGQQLGASSGLYAQFSHLLDYFPSMSLPPFSLLVWLLLGYAVLVAPLLYYVLKKLDKREWAWLLIPLIAIVASGGIYLAGTSGESSVRSHTLNIMELDGKGHAERKTLSALFVPRGGTYNIELPPGTYLSLKREDGLFTGGQDQEPNRQSIRMKEDHTTVKLKGMTHRSLAKLWIEQPESREFGAIRFEIFFDEDGKLQGIVTNLTNKDLSDAVLIMGNKMFKLGDLPQQKTAIIPNGSIPPHYDDYGSVLFPHGPGGSQQDDRLLERQRGMLNYYLYQPSMQTGRSLFVAWDKDSLSSYKVNGKTAKSDQLNMWVQPVVPTLAKNGKVFLPFGFVTGQVINDTSVQWGEERPGRLNMSPGNIQIEYRLPLQGGIEYSELTLRQQDRGTRTTVTIWNERNKDWQKLTWTNGETTFKDQINQYLQNGSILRVRITAEESTSFDIPEISLQGRGRE